MDRPTTPMPDIQSLISRVEAATEGGGQLNRCIFATVHADRFDSPEDAALYARPSWTLNRANWVYLRDLGMPDYTASIDAAMTLVPEGARWTMRTRHPGDKHRNVNAYFVHLESHDFKSVTWGKGENWITDRVNGWDVSAWAATPALALVAASLKARAQQGEG